MTPTMETWNPLIRSNASKVYRSFHGTVEYEDCLQQGYEIFCNLFLEMTVLLNTSYNPVICGNSQCHYLMMLN